ncbi:hypothetical protein Salat_0664500, partial [Sesamum alatum]
TKQSFRDKTDFCTLLASNLARTMSTVITAPIDMIKTRLMLPRESKRVGSYRNVLHCAYQGLLTEGPPGLYKGPALIPFHSVEVQLIDGEGEWELRTIEHGGKHLHLKSANTSQKNIEEQTHQHVNAHSSARFDGVAPEPRKGIRSWIDYGVLSSTTKLELDSDTESASESEMAR